MIYASSFTDMNGQVIREGDVLFEAIEKEVERYHYEERFDMMGGSRPRKIVDGVKTLKGWCARKVTWDGDCLIAERIADSGNIATAAFYYMNKVFPSHKFEVLGNVLDGYKFSKPASDHELPNN